MSSNWIKTKIGDNIYEFSGDLPDAQNCVNFTFLVHPLNKSEDYKYITKDLKVRLKMKKWIEREENQFQKEIINAAKEKRAINYSKKPRLVETMYNAIGVRIIGDIYLKYLDKLCHGALILVPYLPEQFIQAIHESQSNNYCLTLKIVNDILKAVKLSQTIGAKITGLGAYISIFLQNFVKKENNVLFSARRDSVLLDDYNIIASTSGNDLTAAGIFEGIMLEIKNKGLNPNKLTISIIGGTGSVGSAAVKIILTKANFKNITICARRFNKLKKLKKYLSDKFPLNNIFITNEIQNACLDADVVVFAINSIPNNIEPNWFKDNVIICDASQPQVITQSFCNKIVNSSFLLGAIFEIPGNITGYEFLRMGKANQAYGCLSATIARAMMGQTKSCGNGIYIDHKQAIELLENANKLGIKPINIKKNNKINL